MPIIYALVCRGTNVLAEHTDPSVTGNFNTVTRVLLQKIDPKMDVKMSYMCGEYIFHYAVVDEITYLVMANKDFPRLFAFQFLNEVQPRFINQYGGRAKTAIAYAFNTDFQYILRSFVHRYNQKAEKGDSKKKIDEISSEIEKVQKLTMKNLDKVVGRGEHMELLVEKSDKMDTSATRMKGMSERLRRNMWLKNLKTKLIIIAVLLVVLYIIIGSICGFDFSDC